MRARSACQKRLGVGGASASRKFELSPESRPQLDSAGMSATIVDRDGGRCRATFSGPDPCANKVWVPLLST